jgi:hypothetical protein
MPLTPEQRAEINRQNAQKSTGPKSDAGKAASRGNALKHGLRAEVLTLPEEDPAIAESRAQAWNDHYQPQSPAAQHLLNQCVAATLLADRVNVYHHATLSKQLRDARFDHDTIQQQRADDLEKQLATDPKGALRGLLTFATGVHVLIRRWERLDKALDGGCWSVADADEAVRLMGADPAELRTEPAAWVTRLFGLGTRSEPAQRLLDEMFTPRHLPGAYRGVYSPECYPERARCRAALKEMIAEKLESLHALASSLIEEFDTPDRLEAPARALIVRNGPDARLFLRYHAEARIAFQKAFSALEKVLASDAKQAATAPASPSPNEATAPASTEPPASPIAASEPPIMSRSEPMQAPSAASEVAAAAETPLRRSA